MAKPTFIKRLMMWFFISLAAIGALIALTIASNGEVESKVLIKSMSYFVTIMPPESRQVSARSIIIPTSKDHRFCLMRLNF